MYHNERTENPLAQALWTTYRNTRAVVRASRLAPMRVAAYLRSCVVAFKCNARASSSVRLLQVKHTAGTR
jgi:hypothetical protein